MSATRLRASRERVDVWRVALAEGDTGALYALSPAERTRAARLRWGAGRWVTAHVALRRVLGSYLDQPPERVALVTGPNGKPRLESAAGADLRFNLSHSGAMALIAVRLGNEVGVDVEQIREEVDGAAITRDLFNERERASMTTHATGSDRVAFFRAWVRREALAKATGRGIADAPREGEAAPPTVRDLDGIPGYAAAVASEGAGWMVAGARYASPECRSMAPLRA